MDSSKSAPAADIIGGAGDALQAFTDGPAKQAADAIGEGFERAGQRISSALERAARTGEFSFRRMVQSILNDLARVAINKVIGGAIGSVLGQASSRFSGARADGGPVLPGGAYLVGERGPEVFRPTSAGSIDSTVGGGARVVVNFNLGEGANIDTFRRSQGQIMAVLARAVENGQRRL
jgi:phage-related minor tail protein